jgi:hypothetical protein
MAHPSDYSSKSLQDLCRDYPGIWSGVLLDLKSCVDSKNYERLHTLRDSAIKASQRLRQDSVATNSLTTDLVHDAVKARMTELAINQFAQVLGGRVGEKPSLFEKAVFWLWLVRSLYRTAPPTCEQFDRIWFKVRHKSWACSQLQALGYWSIPTTEFCQRIVAQSLGRPILEIAAGHGLLAKGILSNQGNVTATDNFTWASSQTSASNAKVIKLNAEDALEAYKPSFVVCSWPPPGNTFEEKVFLTPSVQTYIVIVSKHKFASGNWNTYQQQSQFVCTSSEPLNSLLRPKELDQQALIFRRK